MKGIFYTFVRKFTQFFVMMKDLFNYKVVCIYIKKKVPYNASNYLNILI